MHRKANKRKPKNRPASVNPLGKALHVVKRGLVVKTFKPPKLGRPVFDSKQKRIGNVVDVFGPAKTPYALIKPASGVTSENHRSLIGSDVFLEGK